MKVLVLPSWYMPNGGEFFRDQSLALKNLGHDVTVATIEPLSIKKPNKINFFNLKKIHDGTEFNLHTIRKKYISIPKAEKISIEQQTKEFIQLVEYYIERYGRPDIIHVHSTIWASLAAAEIKIKYNIPYVITEHRGRFVKNQFVNPKELKTLYNDYISRGLGFSSKVITVSNALQKGLIAYEESIQNKLVTIPNMVDDNFFDLKLNITKDKNDFVFFSLAGLVPLKGFDLLIKAFKEIVKNNKRTILYIGGDGPEKTKILSLIAKYSMEKNVQLLGPLKKNEVKKYMQLADVFVLPSKYEAFGVVYIEALVSGTPIIAAKSGGPEDIVEDYNGLIVENEDVMDLAKAMTTMLVNVNKYKKEEIRNKAIEKYSEKSVANRINNILLEAVEKSKEKSHTL